MTDFELALAAGGRLLQRAALRDFLTGNTLHGGPTAVSYYASTSVRLTLLDGGKYCTSWGLADTGDLRLQSLRTYRRATYRMVTCLGPQDGFAEADDRVSIFGADDSYFMTLNHAPGNHFGLSVDGATWVEL